MIVIKRFLLKIKNDERGINLVEWIILIGISAAATTYAVGTLTPEVQSAHEITVDRITAITGGGF